MAHVGQEMFPLSGTPDFTFYSYLLIVYIHYRMCPSRDHILITNLFAWTSLCQSKRTFTHRKVPYCIISAVYPPINRMVLHLVWSCCRRTTWCSGIQMVCHIWDIVTPHNDTSLSCDAGSKSWHTPGIYQMYTKW